MSSATWIPARACRIETEITCAVLLLAGLSGCKHEKVTAAPPGPAPVTVARPVTRDVVEYLEATGTTAPLETVEVRSRVRGFLEKQNFRPGDRVSRDQVLFVIDQRPYQARVDAAQADLQARNVSLGYAQFEFDRIEKLAQQDAAAEVERAEKRSNRDGAAAALAQARAALDSASLDLQFSEVKALIGGRVSRNMVDVGNLVGENTLLATIVNDESIYATFNISEQDVLRLRRMYPGARTRTPGRSPDTPPVLAGLMDEQGYPNEGRLDYVDTQVDATTGTLMLRAIFENSAGALLPGLFVRIRIPVSVPQPALLVSERAIGIDQGQRYVLVAGEKNAVEYRPVDVGLLENGLRAIRSGLTPDDRVIVNGIQRVRPGAAVIPQETEMLTFVAAATRPAQSAASRSSRQQSGH